MALASELSAAAGRLSLRSMQASARRLQWLVQLMSQSPLESPVVLPINECHFTIALQTTKVAFVQLHSWRERR